MLRAKGTEANIVAALRAHQQRSPGDWVIVETKVTFNECGLEATKGRLRDNVIVLSVGPVFEDVFLITNVVVPAPGDRQPQVIRLRERYTGLPDFTRKHFAETDGLARLRMRAEVNQALPLVYDRAHDFDTGETTDVPAGAGHAMGDHSVDLGCGELADACEAWWQELTGTAAAPVHDDAACRDGDVVYVLGRNRRVYCGAAGGPAHIVYQGRKVSLDQARQMEAAQQSERLL